MIYIPLSHAVLSTFAVKPSEQIHVPPVPHSEFATVVQSVLPGHCEPSTEIDNTAHTISLRCVTASKGSNHCILYKKDKCK